MMHTVLGGVLWESQFSTIAANTREKSSCEEERIVLAPSIRVFNPWLQCTMVYAEAARHHQLIVEWVAHLTN